MRETGKRKPPPLDDDDGEQEENHDDDADGHNDSEYGGVRPQLVGIAPQVPVDGFGHEPLCRITLKREGKVPLSRCGCATSHWRKTPKCWIAGERGMLPMPPMAD